MNFERLFIIKRKELKLKNGVDISDNCRVIGGWLASWF